MEGFGEHNPLRGNCDWASDEFHPEWLSVFSHVCTGNATKHTRLTTHSDFSELGNKADTEDYHPFPLCGGYENIESKG